MPAAIELHDTVALGVVHRIGEDRCPALAGRCPLERFAKPLPEEDVVAEDQRDAILADEVPADQERLRKPAGRGLLGVGKRDAEVTAVAEQAAIIGQVGRRRDDQDVADARRAQLTDRMIDHRLAADRQQVLVRDLGQALEP